MKKILNILILILILTSIGCKKEEKVKVLLPDGIPTIALGGIFDNKDVDVTIVSGADLLTAELMQNNYDIIVAPLTAGAKIYLSGKSNYKLDGIITSGNTYLVKKGNEKFSLEDLSDKKIYAYGMNNTPDIVLKTVLSINNINANIEYESSVNDVFSNHFSLEGDDYYLLAEPLLSTIEVKQKKEIVILDLQKELENVFIPQAAIFVNKNKNVEKVLKLIKNSITLLNTNREDYVEKVLSLDNILFPTFQKLGKEVLINAIPRSYIDYKNANENKEMIEDFFKFLNDNNPKILGNSIPNEEFYK